MANEGSEPPTRSVENDERLEEAEELISLSDVRQGQILRAGVALGVFDTIDRTPTPASDIAAELGLDSDHTRRLLRAMASIGVLNDHPGQGFSLSPLGEFFQSDHPESLSDPTLFYHSPEVVSAFTHLPDIVRDGGDGGFDYGVGCSFYDYTEQNPDFAEIYNDTMDRVMATETNAVLDALDTYDFSRFSHVCDVGGGQGHLLCHLLAAHPHLRGTVFDLPSVVADDSDRWASKLGVADRCTHVGGDMFESVPTADGYLLKHVLDNWTDEEGVEILSTIHDTSPPDARVFTIEFLMGSEPGDPLALVDIHQLVVLGGGVSTEADHEKLLEHAGWERVETWAPEEGPLRIVEAKKAQ